MAASKTKDWLREMRANFERKNVEDARMPKRETETKKKEVVKTLDHWWFNGRTRNLRGEQQIRNFEFLFTLSSYEDV